MVKDYQETTCSMFYNTQRKPPLLGWYEVCVTELRFFANKMEPFPLLMKFQEDSYY